MLLLSHPLKRQRGPYPDLDSINRDTVKSTFGWALSTLVALLRWNLFS